MSHVFSVILLIFYMIFSGSMTYASPNIAANICMNKLQDCQLGKIKNVPMNQCGIKVYQPCMKENGIVESSDGKFTQMYNPANASYQACRKENPSLSTDSITFRNCVFAKESQANPTKSPTQNSNTAKEQANSSTASTSAPTSATNNAAILKECSVKPDRAYGCCDIDHDRNDGKVGVTWSYSMCKTKDLCENSGGSWEYGGCMEDMRLCPETTTEVSGNTCKCENGQTFRKGLPSPCDGDDDRVVDGEGAACLQDLRSKALSCQNAAANAVKYCDADPKNANGNEILEGVQKTLGGIESYLRDKSAGSGAYDNCLNAGLASQTGWYALEKMKKTCDSEINKCNSSCDDVIDLIQNNRSEILSRCGIKQSDDLLADFTNESEIISELNSMLTSVQSQVGKCAQEGDADKKKDQLITFMDNMNRSAQQANKCRCQLGAGTASGNVDCSEMALGPSDCALNPSKPGCQFAQVNCLTSNDPRCACFKDSSLPQCGVRSNTLDGASNMISLNGGILPTFDSGDSFKPTTNLKVGDLSGLNEPVSGAAKTTETSGGGSLFGSAGSGGAGGLGGGAGGGGSSLSGMFGEKSDAEERKGLGGFFNTAKSALSGLFGSKNGAGSKDGKSSFSNGDLNNVSGKVDPNKWRPKGHIRGMASDSEIASKYQDIWKTMNKQYNRQTLNERFILGE